MCKEYSDVVNRQEVAVQSENTLLPTEMSGNFEQKPTDCARPFLPLASLAWRRQELCLSLLKDVVFQK